jgi:hypothetical protein
MYVSVNISPLQEFELLVCHRQTVAGVGKVTRAGSRYLKEVCPTWGRVREGLRLELIGKF